MISDSGQHVTNVYAVLLNQLPVSSPPAIQTYTEGYFPMSLSSYP
jgi:hypothetical protein